MRIISGKKRGLKILPPKGNDTRPITDRVKESLFSVLYNYDLPDGSVVADLFCGTGSMGLEALSRGAKTVTFVDRDRSAVAILKKNIDKADFADQSRIITADAFATGAPVTAEQERCDLVFVDPPYKLTEDVSSSSRIAGLFEVLTEQLTEDAIVVVRTNERTHLLDTYSDFFVIDRRRWGTMAVTLLCKKHSDEAQ